MIKPLDKTILTKIIDNALDEDKYNQDVTSDIAIKNNLIGTIEINSRDKGIFCGRDVIEIFAEKFEFEKTEIFIQDGDSLKKNFLIAKITTSIKNCLSIERIMLNLIQFMSATATQSNIYAEKIKKYKTKVTDTRKTIPNLRELQKYSVRVGGGVNHRNDLSDMVLIKDNHLAFSNMTIIDLIAEYRNQYGNKYEIEIECDNLDQVKQALETNVDRIMLDNMNIKDLKSALHLINGKCKTEVSGGVKLDIIEDIAKLQPDYISVGGLTNNLQNIDIGIDICENIIHEKAQK